MPNLGVVKFGIADHFVVADVPGLIVDAHQGAGLGTQFLRHVERVKRICHLVTVAIEEDGRDPISDFEAIENEMALHNPELAGVEKILVLNRIDIPEVAESSDKLKAYADERGLPFLRSVRSLAWVSALLSITWVSLSSGLVRAMTSRSKSVKLSKMVESY